MKKIECVAERILSTEFLLEITIRFIVSIYG